MEQGNSVLVVEHDEAVIRAADWLVDLGPGAGREGGIVVAAGTPNLARRPIRSPASTWPPRRPSAIASASTGSTPGWIEVRGRRHNLSRRCPHPAGGPTCVTGVSGSGKSTLVHDVLARAVGRFSGAAPAASGCPGGIVGPRGHRPALRVDQSPIGRSPRSTPATATGVFARDPPGACRHPRGEGPRLSLQPVQLQRHRRTLRSLPGLGQRTSRCVSCPT